MIIGQFNVGGQSSVDRRQQPGHDRKRSHGLEILMQAKDIKYEAAEIHCDYDVKDASSLNPVSHIVKVLVQGDTNTVLAGALAALKNDTVSKDHPEGYQ